jgi:hypothetical protein
MFFPFHLEIFFSFSASPANRGKGYWKFNSQLLRDSNYIDIVKTCIRDTLSEYYSVGNIDDFLHVELLCLIGEVWRHVNFLSSG